MYYVLKMLKGMKKILEEMKMLEEGFSKILPQKKIVLEKTGIFNQP